MEFYSPLPLQHPHPLTLPPASSILDDTEEEFFKRELVVRVLANLSHMAAEQPQRDAPLWHAQSPPAEAAAPHTVTYASQTPSPLSSPSSNPYGDDAFVPGVVSHRTRTSYVDRSHPRDQRGATSDEERREEEKREKRREKDRIRKRLQREKQRREKLIQARASALAAALPPPTQASMGISRVAG